MIKYQAVATVLFELESASYDAVLQEAQLLFNKCFSPTSEMCISIKIDRKKTALRNIILGVFKPEDVFPFITAENTRKIYSIDGVDYSVRMNSERYFVFKHNPECVCCGVTGTKFILEKHPAHMSPHFNFYAEENGKLILMTKDHIRPLARGGTNSCYNYQTTCNICNNLKGSANLTIEGMRELKMIYDEYKNVVTRKKLALILEGTRNRLALPLQSDDNELD